MTPCSKCEYDSEQLTLVRGVGALCTVQHTAEIGYWTACVHLFVVLFQRYSNSIIACISYYKKRLVFLWGLEYRRVASGTL